METYGSRLSSKDEINEFNSRKRISTDLNEYHSKVQRLDHDIRCDKTHDGKYSLYKDTIRSPDCLSLPIRYERNDSSGNSMRYLKNTQITINNDLYNEPLRNICDDTSRSNYNHSSRIYSEERSNNESARSCYESSKISYNIKNSYTTPLGSSYDEPSRYYDKPLDESLKSNLNDSVRSSYGSLGRNYDTMRINYDNPSSIDHNALRSYINTYNDSLSNYNLPKNNYNDLLTSNYTDLINSNGSERRRDYEPRGDYESRRDYEVRSDYVLRREFESRNDYEIRSDYESRRDYELRGDYESKRDYEPRSDHEIRSDYESRSNYKPRSDYESKRDYNEPERDYSEPKRDYNETKRDYNESKRDYSESKRDYESRSDYYESRSEYERLRSYYDLKRRNYDERMKINYSFNYNEGYRTVEYEKWCKCKELDKKIIRGRDNGNGLGLGYGNVKEEIIGRKMGLNRFEYFYTNHISGKKHRRSSSSRERNRSLEYEDNKDKRKRNDEGRYRTDDKCRSYRHNSGRCGSGDRRESNDRYDRCISRDRYISDDGHKSDDKYKLDDRYRSDDRHRSDDRYRSGYKLDERIDNRYRIDNNRSNSIDDRSRMVIDDGYRIGDKPVIRDGFITDDRYKLDERYRLDNYETEYTHRTDNKNRPNLNKNCDKFNAIINGTKNSRNTKNKIKKINRRKKKANRKKSMVEKKAESVKKISKDIAFIKQNTIHTDKKEIVEINNLETKNDAEIVENNVNPDEKSEPEKSPAVKNVMDEYDKRKGFPKNLVLYFFADRFITPYKTLIESTRCSHLSMKFRKTGREKKEENSETILYEYELIIDGYTIAKDYIKGENVASTILSEKALEALKEQCFSVLVKNQKRGEIVTKEDIEKTVPDKEPQYEIPDSNKGMQIMKLMGWSGMGLGKKEDGIKSPIIVSKNVTRFNTNNNLTEKTVIHQKIKTFLNNYVKSSRVDFLSFEGAFDESEWDFINNICLKLGLICKGFRKNTKKMIVMKSFKGLTLVENLIAVENKCVNYLLIGPDDLLTNHGLSTDVTVGALNNVEKKKKLRKRLRRLQKVNWNENKLFTNLELRKDDLENLKKVRNQEGYRGGLVVFIGVEQNYNSLMNCVNKCGMNLTVRRSAGSNDNFEYKYTLMINGEDIVSGYFDELNTAKQNLSYSAYNVFHEYCICIREIDNGRIRILKSTKVDDVVPDWTSKEFLMEYFRKYKNSNVINGLIFSEEFTIPEKNLINSIAHSLDLKIIYVGKKNVYRYIVIEKKMHPLEMVECLISQGGKSDTYELIWPKIITGKTVFEIELPKRFVDVGERLKCLKVKELLVNNEVINVKDIKWDTNENNWCNYKKHYDVTTNLKQKDIDDIFKIRNQPGIRGDFVIFKQNYSAIHTLESSARRSGMKVNILRTDQTPIKHAVKINDEIVVTSDDTSISTSDETRSNFLANKALQVLSETCYTIHLKDYASGRYVKHDTVNFKERQVLKTCFENYLNEPTVDHLIFPQNLQNSEWQLLHDIARTMNLNVKKVGRKQNKQIIVSKKLQPFQLIEYLLSVGGKTINYELIPPKVTTAETDQNSVEDADVIILTAPDTLPEINETDLKSVNEYIEELEKEINNTSSESIAKHEFKYDIVENSTLNNEILNELETEDITVISVDIEPENPAIKKKLKRMERKKKRVEKKSKLDVNDEIIDISTERITFPTTCRYREVDKILYNKARHQLGFRKNLVIFRKEPETLKPFQIIVESLQRCHIYFCLLQKETEFLLKINDEIAETVTAGNETEAKELIGPKLLKSLQETCFSIVISNMSTGTRVPRFDDSYKRSTLPSHVSKLNPTMHDLLERVYAFLIDYKNSLTTNNIVFRNNYTLLERKTIKRMIRSTLKLKAKSYGKQSGHSLVISKFYDPWQLVDILMATNNESNVYRLIYPTKL